MTCEVRHVTDPDNMAGRVIPWRRRYAKRLYGSSLAYIEARLPGEQLFVANLDSRAVLSFAGRSIAVPCVVMPITNLLYEGQWALPDGGLVVIGGTAWQYPTDCWYNEEDH